MSNTTHTAWRHVGKVALYVQAVHNGAGDRYSYTQDAKQAAQLTEHQCRLFCSYMRDCASVGFWS